MLLRLSPRNIPRVVLPCALLILAPASARSQATSVGTSAAQAPVPLADLRQLPPRVREALAAAARGDTTTALTLLEQATDEAPRSPEALYWRGLLLARTTILSIDDTPRRVHAGYLLSKASDLDPRNARPLLELARLRLKTPLLRAEAERLFRRALTVADASGDAASHADAAYELGQIKLRRYRTGRDRWMLTTTNVIFDPIAARARLHYTREFLQNLARPIPDAGQVDRQEAEALFRNALAAVPSHELSAIGLLGILYDQSRYEEMRRLAAPFITSADASPRVLMAAALATYKLGQLARADTLFTRALARFPDATRLELTHLGRITRTRDSVRIDGLNAAERARTDSAFWEAADPLLSTPENEAKLEYYARLAVADLRFTDDDMRQIGWRTDRGQILARYGEPPIVATFAPSSDADAKDAVGRVITVWFYPRSETEYVFTGPPAMNSAFFAGNHRGYAEEQREEAPFLLDNLPVALAVDSIPVQVARFRGETPTMGQLLLVASLPTDRLYAASDLDAGALALSLRAGPLAALRTVAEDTLRLRLPATARPRRQFVLPVATDANVRLRLEARDPAVRAAVARAHVERTMLPPDNGRLALSDLLVADRFAGAPPSGGTAGAPGADWQQLPLTPRGTLELAPRDTITLYWEQYGLRPDAQGLVAYTMRLNVVLEELDRGTNPAARFFGGLSDLVGLSAVGDAQLGVRFERQATPSAQDRVPDFVTIGMGSAPPGRYRLELEITDTRTTQVARTQQTVHIRRPPQQTMPRP